MKTGAIGAFLIIPILMTGCELNNFHPEGPPFDGNNELINVVNEYLKNQQKRYNCLADNRFYNATNFVTWEGECGGATPKNPDGNEQAQAVRNETLAKGLTVIDANYGEWVSALYLGRATGNFIADTVELTTSGVIGAISGPANTLSALGVGLTTFKGARSSFDLNYFEKQNTTIIVNQMDTNRAKVYGVIFAKKTQPITEYPMAEAIRDLVAYHNAGTPINALTALSRQTAINSQEAENKVRKLVLGVDPTGNTIRTIDDTVDPFSVIKEESLGKLKIGLPSKQVIQFIGNPVKKSPVEFLAGDGMYHQDWYYPSLGMTLSMASESQNKQQEIAFIKLVSPSTLQTKRGIRVGSSMEEVILSYGKEQDVEASIPNQSFVAGSIYGGLIFTFKNGYVTEIFLGAAAE